MYRKLTLVAVVLLCILPSREEARSQVKLGQLTGAPGTFTTATNLVFQSSGNVGYATNPGSGLVQKFRATTGEVLASLQLAAGIGAATLSSDDKTLLVVGVTNQKIYLIDTATLTVRKEATKTGSGFTVKNNILMTQDRTKIFIADATNNQLLVFKGADGSFDRSLSVGVGPTLVSFVPGDEVNPRVAVLCPGRTSSDADTIYFFDLLALLFKDSVTLTGDNVEDFSNFYFAKVGINSIVFVPLFNDNRLAVYDLKSQALASRSSFGKGPTKVVASPDGRFLAVINSTSKNVALLTMPEALFDRDIIIKDMDFSVDSTLLFSSDSKTLYVPSLNTGEVLVYDLDTSTVKMRIKVGDKPTLLTLDSTDGILASLDLGSNLASLVALSPIQLFFPHLTQTSKDYSGLALANLGTESANVTLIARDNSGAIIPGTTNPRILTIPPKQQNSQVTSQVFGFKATDTLEGWVEADTLGSGVSGLYLTGTIAQTQLDGFTAIAKLSKLLGFSRVSEQVSMFGGLTSTEISLINPSDVTATVTLRLWGKTLAGPGNILGQVVRTIAPRSRLKSLLSNLMTNTVYPVDKAYLEVISDVDIQGLEIVKMGDSIAVIPAAIRGLTDKIFYGAQFASGGAGVLDTPIFTNVSFCNTAPFSITLTAEITGEDGKLLPTSTSTLVRTLRPYETLAGTADQVFNFPDALTDPTLYVGTLKVTTDQEGLIGDLLYGDARNGNYLSDLPLQAKSLTMFGFPHLAQGLFGDPPKGLFTGIALFNPGSENATIVIDAYTASGVAAGKSTQILEAGKRLSKTITEIIPSLTQQNGGTFILSSNRPVFAFEVFGSSVEFLAAVLPVVIP